MTLYLSRLRLSRKPSSRALDAILNPKEDGPRLDAHHRLLWAVFADSPDRRRDFLWRAERQGEFPALSAPSSPPATASPSHCAPVPRATGGMPAGATW